VFNTEHLSALFERVIIASGTSNRQTKALASSVRDAVKQAGFPTPRTEGEANGEWIIVDCGAAVVHVMQPTIRTYYHLEEIWGDKPVNIKLASSAVKLVKAAEPEAPVKKPAAKKQAKAVAKKAPAGRPPARAPVKKAAAAKTSPARKAPAKKVAAPAGRVVTRVVGVKKPAAKKAAARPTAAKKAPARKTTARG
jgi:ribosome-associated protein